MIKASDRAVLDPLCQVLAKRLADSFESKRAQLESALGKTSLPQEGWEYSDVSQYLFACVQRGARELLEERGLLPHREKHKNGAEWLFWAEEPGGKAKR